jgi:uncharacterized protein
MKKEFDVTRLDVQAWVQSGQTLSRQDAVTSYPRLAEEAQGALDNLSVCWTAQGELRTAPGAADEVWLHLQAQTRLPLTCQRCLEPLDTAVSSDRWFRFAPDEAIAAALDDEVDEDVLVLEPEFNLQALVEDELLMSLPLVPRHEVCPVPVKLAVADPGFEAELDAQRKPFAALAQLRLTPSGEE